MISISELTLGRSGTLGERWLFYNATFILGVKFISGTIPQDRYIPANGDCLNINDGGLWQISGGTSINDGPEHSPKKNEYFYVFAFGTLPVLILLAVQTRGAYSYIGVKRDDDIVWKQITVTT